MITLAEVHAEATRVVNANPDYVYERPNGICAYYNAGKPSCLVGVIMHNLGYINPQLEARPVINSCGVGTLCDRYNIEIDPHALDFLGMLQGQQDQGVPWGHALGAARMYVGIRELPQYEPATFAEIMTSEFPQGITMGNIGDSPKEYEMEPIEWPSQQPAQDPGSPLAPSVPSPSRAPAAPAPEKVPVPA